MFFTVLGLNTCPNESSPTAIRTPAARRTTRTRRPERRARATAAVLAAALLLPRLRASRRLEIEANEPPALRVLDAVCHDEVVRALGYPDSERSNVKPLQRLLCQLIDYKADDIRKRVDLPR